MEVLTLIIIVANKLTMIRINGVIIFFVFLDPFSVIIVWIEVFLTSLI